MMLDILMYTNKNIYSTTKYLLYRSNYYSYIFSHISEDHNQLVIIPFCESMKGGGICLNIGPIIDMCQCIFNTCALLSKLLLILL